MELNYAIAFLAGLLSFLAPCVLPLLPGYLAYLGGVKVSDVGSHRRAVVINALLFVLGFAVLFSLLGVLLNTLLEAVAYDVQLWLARLGGLLVIFFGLYLAGLFNIPLLEKEFKLSSSKLGQKAGYGRSFLFGFAFAAGWTPCVGPVLGAILGLAAAQPSMAFGLLLTYSLGLGLPFLLLALFTTPIMSWLRRSSRILMIARVVFGILLIAMGILVFTQNLNLLGGFEIIGVPKL
ncbi:MAG: cytochrome c biogenesis protein CcdA [Candidatus Komeilibacteria bacterium]|nr:cytochrome c biogenesis protein CcdA [Candidatus Komeilibacteria bacterium]